MQTWLSYFPCTKASHYFLHTNPLSYVVLLRFTTNTVSIIIVLTFWSIKCFRQRNYTLDYLISLSPPPSLSHVHSQKSPNISVALLKFTANTTSLQWFSFEHFDPLTLETENAGQQNYWSQHSHIIAQSSGWNLLQIQR